jgi:uncharacterized DUF497 family protein
MIVLAYHGFDWDSGNMKKIETRFSLIEVEQFFNQSLMVLKDVAHSLGNMRSGKIRVISARYMRNKEAEYYEKNKTKFN